MLRALALAILLLPVAAGEMADDPAGDQYFAVPGAPVPAPDAYHQVDLLRVWLGNETADAFEVGLTTRPEGAAPDPAPFFPDWQVEFNFAGRNYRITWQTDQAILSAEMMPAVFSELARLESEGRPGETLGRAFVPKELIRSPEGVPLDQGDVLTNIAYRASETAVILPVGSLQVVDDALLPDVSIELARNTLGHLRIDAPAHKSSNGGQDIFVFEVPIANNASQTDVLHLSIVDVPEGWQVIAPSMRAIEAGSSTTLRVAIATPSAHTHGTSLGPDLLLQSSLNETLRARIPLDVLYHLPPQPGGHHPRLFLHSMIPEEGGRPDPYIWLNAQEEDEDANEMVVRSRSGQEKAFWTLPLSPSLAVGIDALAQDGELTLRIDNGLPVRGGVAEASVWLCLPDRGDGSGPGCPTGSSFRLYSGSTDVGDAEAGEVITATIALRPGETGRYAWVEGAALWVDVAYTGELFVHTLTSLSPGLVPQGSHLTLPLLDYMDESADPALPVLRATAGQPQWAATGVTDGADLEVLGPLADAITAAKRDGEWWLRLDAVESPGSYMHAVFLVDEGGGFDSWRELTVEVVTEEVDQAEPPAQTDRRLPSLGVAAAVLVLLLLGRKR